MIPFMGETVCWVLAMCLISVILPVLYIYIRLSHEMLHFELFIDNKTFLTKESIVKGFTQFISEKSVSFFKDGINCVNAFTIYIYIYYINNLLTI